MVVTNLFAFRATDPDVMKEQADPIGMENDAAIVESACGAGLVVCGWGNHGAHLDRAKHVRQLLDEVGVKLTCLSTTNSGMPGHPLYLKGSSKPQPFNTTFDHDRRT